MPKKKKSSKTFIPNLEEVEEDLEKETIIRKTFCKDCVYVHNDKKGSYCYLPPNKDCALQDWNLVYERAMKFAKLEKLLYQNGPSSIDPVNAWLETRQRLEQILKKLENK